MLFVFKFCRTELEGDSTILTRKVEREWLPQKVHPNTRSYSGQLHKFCENSKCKKKKKHKHSLIFNNDLFCKILKRNTKC